MSINLTDGSGSGGTAEGDTLTAIENVNGSDYVDFIEGDDGANVLAGLAGGDFLIAGDGNDTLDGGSGADTLKGGGGADQLIGGGGIDTASYSDAAAAVTANLATGGTGGEAAGDTYDSVENLIGSTYADFLTGNTCANEIHGGSGNDVISGGRSSGNHLYGNAGNDRLIDVLTGTDAFDGGTGVDTLVSDIGWQDSVIFDLNAGKRSFGGVDFDTFTSIENLTIGGSADVIGDGNANVITMTSATGTNTINAGGGDDTVDAGGGNDLVNGDAGNDTLQGGDGNDTINGGAGDDIIRGGKGGDALNGGGGVDTLSYGGSRAGVQINLATNSVKGGDATGDTISGFENVTGSEFNDVLNGNGLSNSLRGGSGKDKLIDRDGDDILLGGNGSDTLNGGAGADTLNGGGGVDTLVYANSASGVLVNLIMNSAFGGDAAGDTITGFENVTGSKFSDSLIGNSDNNRLLGSGGKDKLEGRGGDDALNGGGGNDRIDGGNGHDTETGGSGADTFVLSASASSSDTIKGFVVADDQLEVSAAEFGGGLTAGTLSGSRFVANTTGLAGDLNDRFIYNTMTGDLFFDSNGSAAGGHRLIATFTGLLPVLAASDFDIV